MVRCASPLALTAENEVGRDTYKARYDHETIRKSEVRADALTQSSRRRTSSTSPSWT